MEETATGFRYIVEAYKMGGPYMHFITLMGVVMLLVVVVKAVELFGKKEAGTRWLDLIIMAGSVAVAVGMFSQIVGIVMALEAIREAADVSPEIVFRGAIVSFYAPIWGFVVFIFSLLFYFVLKEVIKLRSRD